MPYSCPKNGGNYNTVKVICGNNCDSVAYTTDTIKRRDTTYTIHGDTIVTIDTTVRTVPKDTVFRACVCDSLYQYDTAYVTDSVFVNLVFVSSSYSVVTKAISIDTALPFCLSSCDSIIYKPDTVIRIDTTKTLSASNFTIHYKQIVKFIPDSIIYKPCCDSIEFKTDTTIHSDTIYKDPYTDSTLGVRYTYYNVPIDTVFKPCTCDSLYSYDTTYVTDTIYKKIGHAWTIYKIKIHTVTRRVAKDTTLSYCLTACDSIIFKIDSIIARSSSGNSDFDTVKYRRTIAYIPDSVVLKPCCDSVEFHNIAQVHSDTTYKDPYVDTIINELVQYYNVPVDTIHIACLGLCDSIVYHIDSTWHVDTLIITTRTGGSDTTIDSGYRFSYTPIDTIFRPCPVGPLQFYLCNQPLNTPPLIPPSDTNPCLTDLLLDANYNAQNNYNNYLDSIRNAFTGNYVQHCLNIDDSFHLRMPFDEYHYTLYYYDQAENLVKTIPPQGVHPITASDSLNDIAKYRAGHFSRPIYPHDSLYSRYWFNTLNSPVQQQTPDGDTTRFWYDRLGRLVLSQNAVQKPYNFSYTMYDALSRVIEVGQLSVEATNYVYTYPALMGHDPDTILNSYMTSAYPNDSVMNVYTRNDSLLNLLIKHTAHSQITHTYYDSVAFANLPLKQQNLRKRISTITYQENALSDSMVMDTIYTHIVTYSHMLISAEWRLALVPANNIANYDNALHYTYDVVGNMVNLLTDVRCDSSVHQRFKRTDYYFDLVGGNVNQVDYERDSADQFIQRYEYNADNQITDVMTSEDSINWTHESGYEYYSYGPMAREVIGDRRVQGIDYAYTINRWIKGVNSSITNPSYDMGADGNVHAPITASIGRDACGFTLNYFNGDYRPISSSNFEATGLPVISLYNGNVAGATYSIKPLAPKTMGYNYSYDQLNRIVSMQAYNGIDTVNDNWYTGTTIPDFKENVSYDENGNILSYIRHGNTIAR